LVRGSTLERGTIEGDSPVPENPFALLAISCTIRYRAMHRMVHGFLSTPRNENLGGSRQDYPAKAKYYPLTDSELVP